MAQNGVSGKHSNQSVGRGVGELLTIDSIYDWAATAYDLRLIRFTIGRQLLTIYD